MTQRALVALVTILVAGHLFAQTPDARRTQTGRSSATPTLALESLTGRDSFDCYCAACHGVDGRGGGPAASALRTPPPDLTTLARRNGGFPRELVVAFVEGTDWLSLTHGSGDMPVGEGRCGSRIVRRQNQRAARQSRGLRRVVAAPRRPGPTRPGHRAFEWSATLSNPLRELSRRECRGCRTDQRTAAERRAGSHNVQRAQRRHVSGRARGQMIEGRGPAAHGDRSMPVWGDVFRRQNAGADPAMRIDAIVTFLRSIQRRPAE